MVSIPLEKLALDKEVANAMHQLLALIGSDIRCWPLLLEEINRREKVMQRIRKETPRGGTTESPILAAIRSVTEDARLKRL